MSHKVSVAELIEQAVLKGRVVSTADLVFIIRTTLPTCEHSDEELTQLIAAIAIRHGCDVAFGMAAPETRLQMAGGEALSPAIEPSPPKKVCRLSVAANDQSPDLSATG